MDQAWVLEVDADGIVRLQWSPGAVVTPEIARAVVAEVDRRCGGRPHRLLISSTAGTVTREARQVFVEDRSTVAVALVGGTVVDRVIASFITGVLPPPMPLRLFADPAQALAWLRTVPVADPPGR